MVRNKSSYFGLLRIGAITKQENNQYKNKIKSAIDKAKIAYYNQLFNKNVNNMRNTWKTINHLVKGPSKNSTVESLFCGGIEYTEARDICEIFSNFFASVPSQLESSVPYSHVNPSDLIPVQPHSLFLYPCMPEECASVISNIEIPKQDKESMPLTLLKLNKDVLSVVICRMINYGFAIGKFPDLLKVEKIVPIFKKGDPKDPTNYRPISLLPYLSKIFEKVIY